MDIHFTDAAPFDVRADALLICAGNDWRTELAELDARFDGQLIPWLERGDFEGKSACCAVPSFGRAGAQMVMVAGVADGTPGRVAHALSKGGRLARSGGIEHLAVAVTAPTATIVEQVLAGNYDPDRYLREADRHAPIAALTLCGPQDAEAARQASVRARWQSWCRDLVNAPAADLYPETLAQAAVDKLGPLDRVAVEVWDFERCRKEGLVGIVAVGQGSDRKGCMIHVRYRPENPKDHIAFVGKGVTFDAGGLSLKPSAGMQTMRCDMGGSATVLGALGAIAELGLPVAVDCFVGAAENMVGGNSFKLGDILRYRNGVTVEIHNTDAEGRLVLADCLISACEVEGVTTVIDAATLTGACIVALGDDFAGLFTDDDLLASKLMHHAAENDELLWRLPLHAPYKRLLKGTWSQIKNIGGRTAGATTAALYLSHFVTDEVAWAHLDIAGSSFRDAADKRWAAGGTGELVRTLTSFVEGL